MTTSTAQTDILAKAKSALSRAQKPGTLQGLPSNQIADFLKPYTLAIANSLPNGDRPDRIIQSAVFEITRNPDLAACTAQSIIGCVLNAAILGLSPALKQCYFIPRKNRKTNTIEACFQMDYRGMAALARRSALVADVYAQVVRKKDKFEVAYGTQKGIVHVPDLSDESEEFIAVYAVIRYTNGGFEFVVMTPAQVEKRRLTSSNQGATPSFFWEKWKAEMWMKTALHFLLKLAPLSDQQAAAIRTDGVTMKPETFQAGEIRAELIPDDDDAQSEQPEEAALKAIREGVQDCTDLDSLERYWQQGRDEWKAQSDIVNIFMTRKAELTNGN